MPTYQLLIDYKNFLLQPFVTQLTIIISQNIANKPYISSNHSSTQNTYKLVSLLSFLFCIFENSQHGIWTLVLLASINGTTPLSRISIQLQCRFWSLIVGLGFQACVWHFEVKRKEELLTQVGIHQLLYISQYMIFSC